MVDFSPNIATADFAENKKRGLMICGYNWGYAKKDQEKDLKQEVKSKERKGFFSERSVNNYPYRNRICHWFELWGTLLDGELTAGPFERSIIQTNWCADQSNNNKNTEYQKCLDEKQNFFDHVRFYEPSVILFMGIRMFEILTSDDFMQDVTSLLGCVEKEPFIGTRSIFKNGKVLKQFRVGMVKYKNCTVIGLPHPTSSRGLSGDYMAAFKDDIGPVLQGYKIDVLRRFPQS